MDINIQWVTQVGTAVTDYFNVLYKEFDLYPPLNGLNDWILATDPPLPNTQFNYTITGLKENTIYRIMVTKACTGLTEIVDEITFIRTGYPIIGTWQGPVVNSYPTLFYSVYYPEGLHIRNAIVKLYDTETYDRMLIECGAPDPAYVVIGRNGYLTGAICPPIGNTTNVYCDLQSIDYLLPSNTSSAVSYFGRDNSAVFFPTCDGTGAQPLLLKYNNDYKLYSQAYPRFPSNFSSIDPTSSESAVNWPAFTFPSDPTQPYPNLNSANVANLSSAICFDPLTATADYTFADGTGRTNINNYLFSFTTSDGVNTIPFVDNSGLPITSHNGSYTIYAPIKIQSTAPGGGNPLGYTITGASVAGGSTTYTYSGGTNAFTVGQEVFVDNVNPSAFNFASISKTIIAATSNSFTVGSFTPVGTYQTGGVANGYTEITNDMTITVDLLPGPVNVITLTNQNYAGLTLIQALNQVAGAINAAGTYTASAVVIAGLPYLKINMPDTSFGSASILFQGPNILAKGGPDIYQVSSPGGSGYSSLSSFNYNGFLYSVFYEATSASIVASDINISTSATNYSHPIDVPVWEMTLVPETPPTTVYSLDHVVNAGDYSLNITLDGNGYSYSANNTTVSVYDGKIFIDSQDLSALVGGPTTPIRLMEFNTTDNTLYVFVDSSGFDNFYIVDVAPWSIITSGVYGQTNYVTTSLVTAWNNLTTGPTAAMGTVTSAPTVPIPCTGVNSIPCLPVPNISWNWGANDGINSALFQDNTKSWTVSPQLYPNANFNIYNYANENLGYMMSYSGTIYYPSRALEVDTVRVSAGLSPTYVTTSSAKVSFSISNGNAYGIFHKNKIVDYTANFNSRTWSNLSRYLIKSTSGRNDGANGFLNTSSPVYHTATTFDVIYYSRALQPKDKHINSTYGLDGTSTYMLFDITDGGTCYTSTSNFVYISLDGGLYEAIDNLGNVLSYQLYKDFTNPSPSNPVQVPLQMVADPNSDLVYGIARDARSDVDDVNIYVFNEHGQVGVIDGSALWNVPICGQISIDSTTGILYFTGKHTRNFYEYDPVTGFWDNKIVPSLYEKVDGYTYGTASPLSRLQGIIERVQGASYIGGGKFVVMNYLQQTFSTELKYTYDVANLFVYDFGTNTVEQVLIGTGINIYSGAPASYNPNYYGESFGVNDYNNDYCYGGLGIKTNPNTGQIFWKKSISDQVYFSEPHTETGVAQIWASSNVQNACSKTIRIWNIQSDGSLIPSKRTILDAYSNFFDLFYDSWYQKVMACPAASGSASSQIYAINPRTLGGCHGVDDMGNTSKYNAPRQSIAGLSTSTYLSGKTTYVYAVDIDLVSPGTITYSVRPTNASFAYNGIFPHQYAVGEVVKISGILSSPVDELNFPNSNTSSTTYATILSITPISFTVANITGTSATYTSGGTVTDAVWASVYSAGNFAGIATDKKGSVIIIGNGVGGGLPGYISPSTTFVLKYKPSDILTQRENPSITATGTVNAVCSATPDGLFRGLSSNMGRMYGQLNNAFLIHVPSQNNYWIMGTKNPTCTVTNITNAVYNAGTIRYTINNSFLVGKIVNIAGITPTTYNLSNVTITNVDTINSPQQWFEISYTGTAPTAFVPPTPPTITGTVGLSPSYVIKVLDDTTLATVATIDLSSINTLLVGWTNPDAWSGRFQYSPAKEEIYLYGNNPALPIYTFSTITNTLVKSSSFNRMVTPYSSLTTIFGTEDVNGVPYYSAYTATDTPTRRWFRLDLGSRNYLNAAHGQFDATANDAVTNFTFNYDFYSSYGSYGDTFGQWKDILDTTWETIPSTITTTLNSTIEFVSFKMDSPIISIVNNTTGYIYPVSNTLNYIPVYSILIDNVNISNADALNFTFANPDNPSCPFTRQVIIYF